MGAWRRYRITAKFCVPRSFAFRWCTDYQPDDGRYGGEDRSIGLQRRILRRDRHRVVFENLYNIGKGWGWERHVVTLHPPDRWHSEGVGNYQQSILDYELVELPDGRTGFVMRWRSRPIGRSIGPRPSKSSIERYVARLWHDRAHAMERDFRTGRRSGRSRTPELRPRRGAPNRGRPLPR